MSFTLSRPGLNRNQIKYLAVTAMLIDHIAWGFVDPLYPVLGILRWAV